MKQKLINISNELAEKIKIKAKGMNMSQNKIINKIIEQYFEEEDIEVNLKISDFKKAFLKSKMRQF